MNRFWSPLVASLDPYVAGEQPRVKDLVKLNTNENPYGPSPRALAAIRAATDDGLRLYPDPESSSLKQAIAEITGTSPAQVFVGNGSDEVLAHVFVALLKQNKPLLLPDITYSFYTTYAGLFGIELDQVPLDEEFRIDVLPYLTREAGAIILVNPNAPTGIFLELSQIERLLVARPELPVVVDEAYIDFGGESAIRLTPKYPNLLVVQTLSKSRSLAGLRVGYAVGHEGLIEGLERVKNCFNSYPIDRLANVGGTAALRDTAYFEECRARVMASRERLTAALRQLGFQVLPSAANFVFARHPEHDAAQLLASLRERAVLVRHFKNPARIAPFLRISVGTEEQCGALLTALTQLLA